MNEGRIVVVVFGVLGLLMIAGPVATVMFATRPGPPDRGLEGDISKAFLATPTSNTASAAPRPIDGIDRLLPKGMPETQVFAKFATSGFTCATDANAATCFRSHEAFPCREDWKVRVIFSDDGAVWSDKAERGSTCL